MHQHRLRRTVHAIVFTGVCTMIAIPAIAQTPPDNTKVNTRDRAKGCRHGRSAEGKRRRS